MSGRGPKPSETITPTRLRALRYLAREAPFAGMPLPASYANAIAMWRTELVWTGLRGRTRVYGITATGRDFIDALDGTTS